MIIAQDLLEVTKSLLTELALHLPIAEVPECHTKASEHACDLEIV
jgi:hypothetical protein